MNKKLIHTVFEQRAYDFPEKIAIDDFESGRIITYRELNHFSNRIANALLQVGGEPERVVGTFLSPGISLTATLLGVLKSGGVYLPIDPLFERQKMIMCFSNSLHNLLVIDRTSLGNLTEMMLEIPIPPQRILLLENDYSIRLGSVSAEGLRLELHPDELSGDNLRVIPSEDQGCYIFYTSGSTGLGKAFLGTQKGLSHFLHWETSEFNIDASFRVGAVSQITFDASLRDILLPLMNGATLCIPARDIKSNINKLCEWLVVKKISLIHCVPSIFRLLSNEISACNSPTDFPDLKFIFMAGEQLYGRDISKWRSAVSTSVTLVNLYGTSETTMAKTFFVIGDVPADPSYRIPAGKAISNTIIAIIDDGKPCLDSHIGEIYIKTPFCTKGYINDPEMNAKYFVQNPLNDQRDIIFRTGDFGRFDKNGNVEVLGRTDDQVKINGVRVRLTEIEKEIMGHGSVEQAVVVCHQNQEHSNVLLCYYVTKGEKEIKLQSFLRERMPAQHIPSFFVQLDKLPLTINGKVDKKLLPRPQVVLMDIMNNNGPETSLEVLIGEIWKEVLSLNIISRDISFFEIGGSSLQAIQVISRIYRELKKELILADIFNHPTIETLAKVVQEKLETVYTPIPLVKPQQYYVTSHSQRRLWIVNQYNDSSKSIYNMPYVCLLKGGIDLSVLKKTFYTLVHRHEALRTNFTMVEGSLKQLIHPAGEDLFKVEIVEGPPNTINDLQDHASCEALRSFDLEHNSLFRVILVPMDGDNLGCIVNTHHIISDGWSMTILMEEIGLIYDAYRRGGVNPLTPLRVQFKDYAAWEANQMDTPGHFTHREFWLNKFSNDLPVLSLPECLSRPALRTYTGDRFFFSIDQKLTAGLRTLSKKANASLYMTLLAVVNLLLHKISGQKDIIIGTPMTGRYHKDFENIVGNFVNLLPVRSVLSIDEPFMEYLRRLRDDVLEAQQHGAYPFEALVEDLHAANDKSRTPIFDILMQLQDRIPERGDGDHRGIEITPLNVENPMSKFDITFNFTERKSTIAAAIEYNVLLYKKDTIENYAQKLSNIIARAAAEKFLLIKDIIRENDSNNNSSLSSAQFIDADISERFDL